MNDILIFIKCNAGIITAISALVISFYSIVIAKKNLNSQIAHNQKSVKPIGQISFDDYENYLSVELINVGIGPLLIRKVEVINTIGKIGKLSSTKNNLIDHVKVKMPEGLIWENFIKEIEGRVIGVGDKIQLLSINLDDYEFTNKLSQEIKMDGFLKKLRMQLSELEIKIIYTGIYENEQLEVIRDLNWFGRHFA